MEKHYGEVLAACGEGVDSLLDVGCGDGALLRFAVGNGALMRLYRRRQVRAPSVSVLDEIQLHQGASALQLRIKVEVS
jgi:hypothetical protein